MLMNGMGTDDIRQIVPQLLNKWREDTLHRAEAKGGKPAAIKAASTLAIIYRNVRAAFAQAAKPPAEGGAGILQSNPLAIWKPFNKNERKRLAAERERYFLPPKLSPAELRDLLAVADAYPHRIDGQPEAPVKVAASLAVWLMATVGLRWTEAQYARWENINWEKQLLLLQPTEYFTTKSGKSRLVPLPSPTIAKLYAYRQPAGFVLPAVDVENDGLKNRQDRVHIRHHVETIIKSAKLPRHISPHGLRHAFVTLCRESGIPRDLVQAAVGHSSALVTMIYDHSEPDAKVFDALPLTAT